MKPFEIYFTTVIAIVVPLFEMRHAICDKNCGITGIQSISGGVNEVETNEMLALKVCENGGG